MVGITIEEKLPNALNIPFCLVFYKFLNRKNKRSEIFIILSINFHLLFLYKTSHIFIDETSKLTPLNYYQIFNILIYEDNNKFIFPIAHIIMTNKYFLSYEKVFQEINNLLKESYLYQIKNYVITYVFENSLFKAIKEEFIRIKITVCYFHLVKS